MTGILRICILLLNLVVTCAFANRTKPYEGCRILWDISSETTAFSSGVYCRAIRLQDNRIMAVAEGGGLQICFSSDAGLTWSEPQHILANEKGLVQSAPDLIQLRDGTLLIGYNPRPQEPYSPERKFGIRVIKSTDYGKTWSAPIFIFDASHTFEDGCWESSFLELPSGEIHCYFSNEADYTTSNEQCISLSRSFDKGSTWSKPENISFRAKHRDGMPSAVLLKNQSDIVLTIEDNGWPNRHNFLATTVRCPLEQNWKNFCIRENSPYRRFIFEAEPPVEYISAAPYLRQLPTGVTVASFQGNEGRESTDMKDFDMFVCVGDSLGNNFKAQTKPFSIKKGMHALWNSVTVIDSSRILAIASIASNAQHRSTVRTIRGHLIKEILAPQRPALANGSSTGVDKTKTPTSTLYFGETSRNPATLNFFYDNNYLYLCSRIDIRSQKFEKAQFSEFDFYIDVNQTSDTEPMHGMYHFHWDAERSDSVNVSKGSKGRWKAIKQVRALQSTTQNDLANRSVQIETAIPWKILGQKLAPTNRHMSIAASITYKNADGQLITDSIADINPNASATWLTFKLK